MRYLPTFAGVGVPPLRRERPSAVRSSPAVIGEVSGRLGMPRASGKYPKRYLSSIFIALSRLRRIRLNERDREAISSEPGYSNSGTDALPMLTASAVLAIRLTG